MELNEIIEKISNLSNIKKEEIEKRVKEKQLEFSGLISMEGAAHIVAKELGISLLKKEKKILKIENITSGMSSVNVLGKVVRIFEPREFEKDGRKGKVVNLILGDETGTIRISLWEPAAWMVLIKAISSGPPTGWKG